MFEGQRLWLVGASEGLGRALAVKLAGQGASLVLSARSADRLSDLSDDVGGAEVVPMDVTDPGSVRDSAERVGPVDMLIYCVGLYEPMRAQDWDSDKAVQMAEANFMGALRLLGHVVPDMAARDHGMVVLIGSLAGFSGLPGAIGYGASKAGLMHLAQNMQADLRGTKVQVRLVNPGFIKTRLTDKNDFEMPQIQTPDEAADHVIAAMRGRRFQVSFPTPFAWLFSVLGRYLPRSLFLRLFRQR